MKKRVLSLILAMAMVLALVAIPGFKAEAAGTPTITARKALYTGETGGTTSTACEYDVKMCYHKYEKVVIKVYDTSGEEKFRTITKNFYRNADGLLVVFDLTRKETYDHVRGWINEAKENNDKIKTILIGNKLDLKDERKVENGVAKQFAEKNSLKYLETSAKDGINISESFKAMIDLLFDGKSEEEILNEFKKQDSSLSVVDDSIEVKNKKKACC